MMLGNTRVPRRLVHFAPDRNQIHENFTDVIDVTSHLPRLPSNAPHERQNDIPRQSQSLSSTATSKHSPDWLLRHRFQLVRFVTHASSNAK